MKFSVAMCVYQNDKAGHFEQCLKSLISQTLPPSEIILVVDGPISKELNKIIVNYKSFLKIVYLEKNMGHAYARNTATKLAQYEYVAIMDADDICKPDRFEKQISYIKKNQCDVLGGQIEEFINDLNNITGKRIVPTTQEGFMRKIKYTSPFNNMTVMFRTSIFQASGGYNQDYFPEDWFLFIKMYLMGAKFANLSDIVVSVRADDMHNRRYGKKYMESVVKIYKFLWKKKIINSVEMMLFVIVRYVFHVMMPGNLRVFFYNVFLRVR